MCNAKDFGMKEGEKKGEKKAEKKWMKKGKKMGIQEGIKAVISILLRKKTPLEEMITDLQDQFQLSRREALRQVRKAMA